MPRLENEMVSKGDCDKGLHNTERSPPPPLCEINDIDVIAVEANIKVLKDIVLWSHLVNYYAIWQRPEQKTAKKQNLSVVLSDDI